MSYTLPQTFVVGLRAANGITNHVLGTIKADNEDGAYAVTIAALSGAGIKVAPLGKYEFDPKRIHLANGAIVCIDRAPEGLAGITAFRHLLA